MEQLRQRESENNHPLRREAVLPSSLGPTRPCLLVGLSLVALCFAASLDAFLWHQSRERQDAEVQLQEARVTVRELSAELLETRQQLAERERELRKRDHDAATLERDAVIRHSSGIQFIGGSNHRSHAAELRSFVRDMCEDRAVKRGTTPTKVKAVCALWRDQRPKPITH